MRLRNRTGQVPRAELSDFFTIEEILPFREGIYMGVRIRKNKTLYHYRFMGDIHVYMNYVFVATDTRNLVEAGDTPEGVIIYLAI